ncbi:hypothetical protein EV363DRAFT_1280545 [Boletus edulis]|uniref:Uncharacterized protein n=1 Tax=Boletus edulis BED1 TaxID=1328754 RepID=A0AAD4BF76_BOLED|nr:hypothetical protein EV363DRAFT_1280545 [Boletus edulis]KAF8424418.1 hypothetical protein L210DRAFT_952802 [Boletus edulis BED1]
MVVRGVPTHPRSSPLAQDSLWSWTALRAAARPHPPFCHSSPSSSCSSPSPPLLVTAHERRPKTDHTRNLNYQQTDARLYERILVTAGATMVDVTLLFIVQSEVWFQSDAPSLRLCGVHLVLTSD